MEYMNRRKFIKASISASLMGSATFGQTKGRGDKRKSKRPNILWIMMDDGRADAVGCYGKSWAKTPNMDRIASQGVWFETAIVQNPVCVPSRKSMKSGHYPHTFGLTAMGKPAGVTPAYMKKAEPNVDNLVNCWKQVGINPVNVGKRHAYQKDWISKGDRGALIDFLGNPKGAKAKDKFEKSKNEYGKVNIKTHRWMIGGVVPFAPEETQTWRLGDLGVETLKELAAGEEPFFLRVSFHAPHVPCRVPREFFIDPEKITLPLPTEEELKNKPRFERENLHIYAGGLDLTKEQIGICRGTYYGMVSLVDAQVGRLVECLKEAGLLNNTIIAINSDQGFQLGEHGLWKKRVFYEQNVCVPFIMSCPGLLPSGKVIDEPVEMIDFMPTLMELSGIDVPRSIRGRSLMPLIRGEISEWRPACFSEIDHSYSMYEELREGSGRRVMVRTKEWKLIYFMDERVADKDGALYNLKRDKDEKENLYNKPRYKRIIKRLESLAEKWDKEK
ncbi:MAG: sulfatase-like hydrolase/transferase [Planctomycetes bacterium]|nr:sulfatase-like hydrolase/transferase [Planctomycetota bacterium]